MIDPNDFLRCVSDPYTQVRDEQGRLLGCIPRINEGIPGIRGSDGQAYLVRIAAVACICCPPDKTRALPMFIPVSAGTDADLALPPVATE